MYKGMHAFLSLQYPESIPYTQVKVVSTELIRQDINQFQNNVKLVFEQLYLILQLKPWKESTNVKSVRTKVHTSHM